MTQQSGKLLRLCGTVIGGLVAAGASAWLIVALMNLFTDRSAAAQLDDRVASWLTVNGSDLIDRILGGLGLLGGWGLVGLSALIVAALLVRRDVARAAAVLIAGVGAFTLNSFLKLSFEHAHSLTATSFTSAAQGWTFPSGHALNALVLYGMLTCFLFEAARSRASRTFIVAGAVSLILVIGFSRVYFGVHSLSEVVTGYLAGSVWLVASVAVYRQLDAMLPRVARRAADDLVAVSG